MLPSSPPEETAPAARVPAGFRLSSVSDWEALRWVLPRSSRASFFSSLSYLALRASVLEWRAVFKALFSARSALTAWRNADIEGFFFLMEYCREADLSAAQQEKTQSTWLPRPHEDQMGTEADQPAKSPGTQTSCCGYTKEVTRQNDHSLWSYRPEPLTGVWRSRWFELLMRGSQGRAASSSAGSSSTYKSRAERYTWRICWCS